MRVRIQHELHYVYSREVFCEPVMIRLRPREDAAQRIRSWKCSIAPEPEGISEFRDLDGNIVLKAWFEGLTSSLRIMTDAEVETLQSDPYRFLLNPEAAVLPARLDPIDQSLAAHYAKPGTLSPRMVAMAEELERQAGRQTIRFLMALTSHLNESCQVIIRPTGEAWPAEKTLSERAGSCRDLAVLFCEVCRSAGLPARFVSGYSVDPDLDGLHHLHAWGEVYLAGAGWRGFDPTAGLAVGDRHIAVAAARLPPSASPTSGAFRGTGVSSQLEANVRVVPLEADAPRNGAAQPSQPAVLPRSPG
ncbi:MAG: transglutaminase family protein [Planctomyces sp.]|nr:transglutaminase family protein [Planctomyces sp.]